MARNNARGWRLVSMSICLSMQAVAAEWISPSGKSGLLEPAEFRRSFVNGRAVRKAVWRMSGLGVYEARVNDRVVSGFLEPGYTDVRFCRLEFAHDVTSALLLEAGARNELSATVSCSWWCDTIVSGYGKSSRKDGWDASTKRPAFRGELSLTYADGGEEVIGTDADWQAAWGGETTYAGIYEGEDVDFRRRGRGAFSAAVINSDFDGEIRSALLAAAVKRRDLMLPAKEAWVYNGIDGAVPKVSLGRVRILRRQSAPGPMALGPGETLVVDFGQNAAFVPEVVFAGAEGTTVTMHPGEVLCDDNGLLCRNNDGPEGSIRLATYRGARSVARVTLSGTGDEVYSPRFTFFGGRYLSIVSSGPVLIKSLVSLPVSAIRSEDERGVLETGDAHVNRLVKNVEWSLRSNCLGTPQDCPQRNERLGWTADANVIVSTAAYFADVKAIFSKYLCDLRDGVDERGFYPVVGPVSFVGLQDYKFGWTDAPVLMAHKLWWHYGDRRIVDDNWSAMEKYVRLVESFKGCPRAGEWQYADWLSLEKCRLPKAGEPDPKLDWWSFLGGCYLLMDEESLAEMAAGTGRAAAAAEFSAHAAETRRRLRCEFFDEDGTFAPRCGEMQTAYAVALVCRLFDGEARIRAVERLVRLVESRGNRLSTGILGTSFLLRALSENGRTDVAYTLLLQKECPGWMHSVLQGATTCWERWDGYTKKDGFSKETMNSFNHHAFGCVLGWLYETAAGIRPLEPGYRKVSVDPHPDPRLKSLKARFVTPMGEVVSVEWSYDAEGSLKMVKSVR